MSAAAIITLRRKRLVKRFREAGAIDPEHAVSLDALGERQSWIFEQMLRKGVFVRTQEGRFYMDEPLAIEFLRIRKRLALLIGGIMLLVCCVLWALGFFQH